MKTLVIVALIFLAWRWLVAKSAGATLTEAIAHPLDSAETLGIRKQSVINETAITVGMTPYTMLTGSPASADVDFFQASPADPDAQNFAPSDSFLF